MKRINIYSQAESMRILGTYINDVKIVDRAERASLRKFLHILHSQGIFLGHMGDITPFLSRVVQAQ